MMQATKKGDPKAACWYGGISYWSQYSFQRRFITVLARSSELVCVPSTKLPVVLPSFAVWPCSLSHVTKFSPSLVSQATSMAYDSFGLPPFRPFSRTAAVLRSDLAWPPLRPKADAAVKIGQVSP